MTGGTQPFGRQLLYLHDTSAVHPSGHSIRDHHPCFSVLEASDVYATGNSCLCAFSQNRTTEMFTFASSLLFFREFQPSQSVAGRPLR
jgi:hypothetical protein